MPNYFIRRHGLTALVTAALTAGAILGLKYGCAEYRPARASELGMKICPKGIYLADVRWDPNSDYFEVMQIAREADGSPKADGTRQYLKTNVLAGLDLENCQFLSKDDLYDRAIKVTLLDGTVAERQP